MQSLQPVASLLGRILLSSIFVISGFGKLMDPAMAQGYMTHANLPMVKVLYVLTVIVELGGGLLLLLGWQARWAALVLFLFLIPVTLSFHLHEQVQLLKNVAIMGGLLTMVACGPGPISLDGQTRRSRPGGR